MHRGVLMTCPLVVVAALGLAESASASSPYPSRISTHLDASDAPSCTICHQTTAGGSGTVTQPFGQAMMAAGLTGGENTDALVAALDALDANGTDSDGDGQGDVDELRAGADPNRDADIVPSPEFGFGCAAAPTPAGALALVLGLAATVRRRRRKPGSGSDSWSRS